MARPLKFDDVTVERILAALRAGNTEADAAAYAGVDDATMRRWKAKDAQFRAAVQVAKAGAKIFAVTTIHKAIQSGSWKAALAWLERRYPSEWGKRDTLDINIRAEAERIAAERGIPAERIISLADELKKRKAV